MVMRDRVSVVYRMPPRARFGRVMFCIDAHPACGAIARDRRVGRLAVRAFDAGNLLKRRLVSTAAGKNDFLELISHTLCILHGRS